ncbi:MAG: SDR family oxidoreductase [Pseudomonadota bacterium]
MDTKSTGLGGKVALVTGASSGFGQHFAKLLAAEGAKVVVAARRLDRLDALVSELSSAGCAAMATAMDVTQQDSVRAAFDAAEAEFGPVSVVSNNAGVVESRLAAKVEETDWDYAINTNLKGAWFVAREAGRRLLAADLSGSIVNTASILGLRPAIGQSVYATSKAGLIHLTRCLALEWARKGIRVNALCPGFFVTDINREFLDSEAGQQYLSQTPAQRAGRFEELSAPFLLLASDSGSFITGETLTVDDGHTLSGL